MSVDFVKIDPRQMSMTKTQLAKLNQIMVDGDNQSCIQVQKYSFNSDGS